MIQQIENYFKNNNLPSYYRDVFERVDFSFLNKPFFTLGNLALTNENNVGKFLYNIMCETNDDSRERLTQYQLEEVYGFIINNPEIRVMNLPIAAIDYDEFHRSTYSVETAKSWITYRTQKDKMLLYSAHNYNSKLFYRYAVDKNGIVIRYEYI